MFDNENIEETQNGGGQNVNEGDFEDNGNRTPHLNSNRDELEDERAESVSEISSRNRSPTPDVTLAEKYEFLRDMAEKLQSAVYSMENLEGNSKDILYRMESVAKQIYKSMGRLTEITGTMKQALDLSTKTNQELLKFLLQNGGGTPSGTGSINSGPEGSGRQSSMRYSRFEESIGAPSSHSRVENQRSNEKEVNKHISFSSTPLGIPNRNSEFELTSNRELNNSVTELVTTLQSQQGAPKVSYKRDYILKKDTNFDLWMDRLHSELSTADLLFILDLEAPRPVNLDEAILNNKKRIVRDIIINHLDETYHSRVLKIRDPVEIIQTLRGFRRDEANLTPSNARIKFYKMKMTPGERFISFCERFEKESRVLENCANATPLSAEEKRAVFYNAVLDSFPTLSDADSTCQNVSKREFTIEEIKSFCMRKEAEKKQTQQTHRSKEYVPKVNRVEHKKNETKSESENVCYRCNELGHRSTSCPKTKEGLWYCYGCHDLTRHIAAHCPKIASSSGTKKPSFARGKQPMKLKDKKLHKVDKSGKVHKKSAKNGNHKHYLLAKNNNKD